MTSRSGMWIGLLTSMLLSFALFARGDPEWPAFGWSAGNLIAALNALLTRHLHQRAVGSSAIPFLLWGLLANGARAAFVVAALALAHFRNWPEWDVMLVSALIGYFLLLFLEIFRLHFRAAPLNMPRSSGKGVWDRMYHGSSGNR